MWPSAITAVLLSTLWYSDLLKSRSLLTVGVITYLSVGGYDTVWKIYRTLPRDLKGLFRYIKLQLKIRHAKRNNLSVPKIFREIALKNPQKVAFYFEDQTWTFKEVDSYSNKIGNFFAQRGIKHGDSVALFMENRVEYVCIWLGLTKIGAVPALINFNLRQDPLKHCIRVANCKAIIVGEELQDEMLAILGDGLEILPTYVSGAGKSTLKLAGATNCDVELESAAASVPPELESVGFVDDMVYIYTSGTTGLPKAAVIKHSRFTFFTSGVFMMLGLQRSDNIYDPLPLYHTAGGMLGVGQVLLYGLSAVLSRKFSSSRYWRDVAKYQATAAQYIGEICRYLYNMPPKPEDTQHNVRIMFGNGLRPNLWADFQKRFNIPHVSEFYGSTEGNANIINIDGKPGAVGFVSVLFPSVYPVALLKVDQDTGEILRGENGLCIRCKPGEAGEFVGKIVKGDPVRDFHGYADKRASEKKIVHDVFQKGDTAFLSGDILVMDAEGYLYFKDRTGDTFRWKGENVSTTEVEAVVSKVAGHADVVVYGVEVPGAEGRAGMASILDPEGELNLQELYDGLVASLASYARPLFVRCTTVLERTGTFKLKKITLQKEGFDPSCVKDKLFLLDARKKAYVPLTPELYEGIIKGDVRV